MPGLRGNALPWIISGAAVLAVPLLYVGKKLKSWYQLKHLPTHVLKGPNGLEAHISPLGAVIQRLYVPDAQGNLEDVRQRGITFLSFAVVLAMHALRTVADELSNIFTSLFPLQQVVLGFDSMEPYAVLWPVPCPALFVTCPASYEAREHG